MTYNGYENYPTWAVALWLDNSEADQNRAYSLAKQAQEEAPTDPRVTQEIWTEQEATRFLLADYIKHDVEAFMPELAASLYSDLLTHAVGQVNWQEIADCFLAD